MLKLVYVWEFPVRLTHWVNFLAIVVLSFTGYYIGTPFSQAPAGEFFYMATMRFIHFVAAYVFTVSVLLRIYWAFVGNEYSRWREFLPFWGQRRRDLVGCVYYYSFIRRECPPAVGHSATAAVFLPDFASAFPGRNRYRVCPLRPGSPEGIFLDAHGGMALILFSISDTQAHPSSDHVGHPHLRDRSRVYRLVE